MKKQELRIGDTVKCVDDKYSFNRVREGNLYKIVAAYDGTPIVEANGAYMSLERFEKMED